VSRPIHPSSGPAGPTVVIEVPVPGLVVLVGAAGAGKSTLARRLFADDEILSSDALRAAISGDPGDQRATRVVFAALHREAASRLAAGRLVVVDATNVERAARRSLLRIAAAAGVPAVAVVVAAAGPEVHGRNAGRTGRIVPPEVVDRHLDRLAGLGTPDLLAGPLRAEGFAAAHVLTTVADLDTAAIVRVPARISPP
jgi:protein phosphatase